uniref:Uncharacterized protein n=1 Tax=Panagrolaimus sp. ES5 TaxID=591445 RepID=A0AC34G4H1_9BILA
MKLNSRNTLNFEILSIWNNRPTVKVFLEPYANASCLNSYDIAEAVASVIGSVDLSTCQCQPFVQQNGEAFVPFKVWTENGPARFQMSPDVYVFEEVEQKMITHKCLNEGFFQSNYSGFDYTDLLPIPEIFDHNVTELIEEMNQTVSFFNDNGTDYINLMNPVTVVWSKIKDSAPEHYLLVETETAEMMQKTFEIGLEANGRESPEKEVEVLSNGLKITFLKELCIPNYKFFGFVRYIITVNETGLLKASFWDKKSGENLKLYFLGEEANGIPKVAPNETNFGKILLPLTTKTTSTTTTSTTVASTSTSTTSKPATSESDTKNEFPEETMKPVIPEAHGKDEAAEASGLSLWILILIIIFSIIG